MLVRHAIFVPWWQRSEIIRIHQRSSEIIRIHPSAKDKPNCTELVVGRWSEMVGDSRRIQKRLKLHVRHGLSRCFESWSWCAWGILWILQHLLGCWPSTSPHCLKPYSTTPLPKQETALAIAIMGAWDSLRRDDFGTMCFTVCGIFDAFFPIICILKHAGRSYSAGYCGFHNAESCRILSNWWKQTTNPLSTSGHATRQRTLLKSRTCYWKEGHV